MAEKTRCGLGLSHFWVVEKCCAPLPRFTALNNAACYGNRAEPGMRNWLFFIQPAEDSSSQNQPVSIPNSGQALLQVTHPPCASPGCCRWCSCGHSLHLRGADAGQWVAPISLDPGKPLPNLDQVGIGAVALVTGFGLMLVARRKQYKVNRLFLQGCQAQGTVIDAWQQSDKNSTRYYVSYAFTVPRAEGGAHLVTHSEQNRELYDTVRVGDAIVIHYDPQDPDHCLAAQPPHQAADG
jgi:hypothetical protein